MKLAIHLAILTALVGVTGGAASQEAATPAPKRELVAIKCGRIHTVSHGTIDRGVIVVENGLIVDVLRGDRVPDGAKVIDASDQVVVPGFVDGSTWLADGGASSETVSVEVKAVDGIDVFSENRRALEGGVTCVYVAPGTRRLMPGRGAVVKTAGRDRILRDTYGLHVILGDAVKNPPAIYKPTILPSADNPILPAKRQVPATRMGQFAELRKTFENVQKLNGKPDLKNGWTLDRVDAFAPVLSKREPLFVSATAADDLVKAVLFAESFGLKAVLVDAVEAHQVASFLAERKVPVLLQMTYNPRTGYGIDERRPAKENGADIRSAATLAKAGVPLALHAPGDLDLTDLLFLAGTAVRWGLPEEEALRAITLRPAEFLGVADRVGSIERGKHADLVFLNADPFQAVALPQRVMVDGAFVYQRKPSDNQTYDIAIADAGRAKDKDLIAIKAGKILSVTQGVIQDGLILISNGKITYVGRGQAIPKSAKVIDASGDIVIPGMIDLNSHLGFHIDENEFGRGVDPTPPQIQVPPSKLIRLDDPALRDASAGGVTTILVAPRQTGPCSVVKLHGQTDAVVREVGAYKFVVQGGSAAQDQMRQLLQRAKKYHEEWEAYEKSLKEGKTEAPKTTAPVETKGDPITGTWKGTMEVPDYGIKSEFTAEMKLVGTKVTATVTTQMGGQQDSDTIEGTFVNNELKLSGDRDGAHIEITMKLEGANKLKGSWKVSMQGMEMAGPIECSRVAEGQPAATATPKSDKKEPRRDETLDPFRPLFRKEIPALLETRDYPAIENAVKIFRDEFGFEFVLVGADDAIQLGDLLFQKLASAAFGADFLTRKRGATINIAEALASTGVPVAFYSDETSGTKFLPFTAAYAVRYGLDPFDALKALTLHPARMLGLQNRLGSLERGRDADLVIWSGEPFNLNSRVKKVIINGKIVHE